jgi:low affinity Fe/Cu permease
MIVRNRRAHIGAGPIDAARPRQGGRHRCCSARRGRSVDALQLPESLVSDLFQHVTSARARFIGRPLMMILCLALAVTSIVAFASRDELAITGTNLAINVLTLLFLPILQATQNRDGAALQAKLDELIKVNKEASDDFIGLEDRAEDEIEEMRPVPESVTDPHPQDEPVG